MKVKVFGSEHPLLWAPPLTDGERALGLIAVEGGSPVGHSHGNSLPALSSQESRQPAVLLWPF